MGSSKPKRKIEDECQTSTKKQPTKMRIIEWKNGIRFPSSSSQRGEVSFRVEGKAEPQQESTPT
jgi:hypothetical protein